MMGCRFSTSQYAAGAVALAACCIHATANGAEVRRIVQFQMTSTTFEDGGLIPPKVGYTKTAEFPACFGENISPQLSWLNVRPEVKSFALTVHELEDPPNVSLVVYGISADIRSLAEGELSKASDKFVAARMPATSARGAACVRCPVRRSITNTRCAGPISIRRRCRPA